jgi:hypothetical protein
LPVWCQRCHLTYDASTTTRRDDGAKALGDLFACMNIQPAAGVQAANEAPDA